MIDNPNIPRHVNAYLISLGHQIVPKPSIDGEIYFLLGFDTPGHRKSLLISCPHQEEHEVFYRCGCRRYTEVEPLAPYPQCEFCGNSIVQEEHHTIEITFKVINDPVRPKWKTIKASAHATCLAAEKANMEAWLNSLPSAFDYLCKGGIPADPLLDYLYDDEKYYPEYDLGKAIMNTFPVSSIEESITILDKYFAPNTWRENIYPCGHYVIMCPIRYRAYYFWRVCPFCEVWTHEAPNNGGYWRYPFNGYELYPLDDIKSIESKRVVYWYNSANQLLLVEDLGCGCPEDDETYAVNEDGLNFARRCGLYVEMSHHCAEHLETIRRFEEIQKGG